MTLRFAACVLLLMAFSVPAMPATGAASDLPTSPAADPWVAPDTLPAGVHVDGLPQGSLEPLPPVDMSQWWAIPIHSHGSASDPAVAYGFLVLDFEDLHLQASDALARGLTLVPFSEFGSWSDSEIAASAVPIGDALLFSRDGSGPASVPADGAQASDASAPTGSASLAAATSGPQMIVAVSYDTTADRGIANEAISQATSFYQDKHGIALNTLATWSYAGTISGYCDLQKAAWQAQNQTVGAVAFVGFSNGVIGESSALSGGYGVYVGGDSATIYSRGESSNSCGGPPITPALLPQVFTSTGFPVNAYGGYAYAANALVAVPTWDADKRGTSYVLAHEFGHFLSMNHNMAHCWYDWWMPDHMHKTLESFTSQYTGDDRYDPPGSCADSVDRQHQNLEPDSHYHWYFNDQAGGGVAAVNGAWARLSGCINARWCTSDATPSAPNLWAASPGNGRVTLSWLAPEFAGADAAGNPGSIKGYCVFTSTSPGFLRDTWTDGDCQDNAATSRTVTTYKDGGASRPVTNGVRHYFYVRAYNFNGGWVSGALGPRSGYADTVPTNHAPPAPGAPSPSDGLTGVSSNPTLSWGSSTDPDGDGVTYNVFAGASHPLSAVPGCQSVPDSNRQCSYGGLQQGVQYHWGVNACDSSNLCSATTDWHFTTQPPANNAPNTPGSPSPGSGASGISRGTGLSWSGGDPDAGNTVTYTVYLDAGSGSPTTARCTNTSSTSCPNSSLGGLSAGTLYTWKVVATDNLGATSQAQWSFTTANAAPSTPSTPSPGSGASGISTGTGLSWSGGDPDSGDSVTYTVYLNAGSGTPTTARCTNTSSTSCPNSSLGGLSAGTLYTWKVVATDNHGATNQAQWSFTTANAAPNTPNNPSPGSGTSGISTGTSLSWSGGDPDSGDSVTYTVYLNAGSGTPTTARCTNTSSTSCPNSSLGGLASGTLYTWKVVATDNHGATNQAQWSFTTASTCTPNAPTNPAATAVSGQRGKVTVSWTAPTNCALSTYKVYRSTASGSDGSVVTAGGCNTGALTGSSTSCTDDSGLGDNTWYYYKVSAVSSSTQGSLEGSKTTSQPGARTNGSPTYPSTPSGPSNGHTGTTYSYSTSATDPDGNSLQYIFDWYDGSGRCTSAWASSGGSASCSHSWNSEGQYCVSAYAQDTITPASPWSYCNWVYINYPGTPLHFQYLTDEGWTVGSTSNPQDIAYGNTFGTWVIKTAVSQQFTCGNAFFGHDPSSGYAKKCYYQNPGSGGVPAGFTYCATEGGTCSLSGAHDIAFGNSHGTWAVKAGYSGSISCSNTNFWDVDPGYQKTCYYR